MPSPRTPRSTRLPPDDQRLSIIAEDGDGNGPKLPSRNPAFVSGSSGDTPPVPPRSTHRPFARRWRDAPPRWNLEMLPPAYSPEDEGVVKKDPLRQLRNRQGVARRGGFRRLCVIAMIVLLVIIALAVGLGVGLGRRDQSSNASPSSSSTTPSGQNQTFPAGQYAINTYLSLVSTACTANAATFRCYPYSTYSDSTTASAASFDWIIYGMNNNYTISSSANPFAITFSNLSLSLIDAGTAIERFTFSYTYDKLVIPSTAITNDNTQAECYFNGTTMSAALYTKRNTSTGSVNATTKGGPWTNWPYAAEVNETRSGGANVPNCYEQPGTPITTGLASQPTSSSCGCYYRNVDL